MSLCFLAFSPADFGHSSFFTFLSAVVCDCMLTMYDEEMCRKFVQCASSCTLHAHMPARMVLRSNSPTTPPPDSVHFSPTMVSVTVCLSMPLFA